MSNHTPGPWKLHCYSQLHGEYTIFAGGDTKDEADAIVCEVAGGLGVCLDGCIESDANARLIAAAPDLLAALIECQAFIADSYTGTTQAERDAQPAWIAGQAAIAKATGDKQS